MSDEQTYTIEVYCNGKLAQTMGAYGRLKEVKETAVKTFDLYRSECEARILDHTGTVLCTLKEDGA